MDSKDGLLDRQGVGVALRLIGYAQSGTTVAEGLVKRREYPLSLDACSVDSITAGPLAVLENISPLSSEPIAGPSSGLVLGALPSLMPHDKAKFKKIFKASGAQNDVLSGKCISCQPSCQLMWNYIKVNKLLGCS